MGKSGNKKQGKTVLVDELDKERGAPDYSTDKESDEELPMQDEKTSTPKGKATSGKANAPIILPKRTPSRKRTPPPPDDDGDDEDEESATEATDSESEVNSDDEIGYNDLKLIWSNFIRLCDLKQPDLDSLAKLGYTTPEDLETLAYDGTVDLTDLIGAGFGRPMAMNIGTFAQFLFGRGDFEHHKTL